MMFDQRFIVSHTEEARSAQESVLDAIERNRYDGTSCFAIRLAFEEALTNAFKHGNKNDPRKAVTIQCRVDDREVVIDIADEGEGFDPDAVPDPTERENLEIPSGRGIVLMRAFMTNVRYDPPGNRVRLTYQRQPSPE